MSDEPTERDAEALAETLLLAMDGDFLPAAGMAVDNAGQDIPIDKARPKEVAWWAARALADRFRCAECEREVRTDNEVVICRCSDEPTCDPCCEAYHEGQQ